MYYNDEIAIAEARAAKADARQMLLALIELDIFQFAFNLPCFLTPAEKLQIIVADILLPENGGKLLS